MYRSTNFKISFSSKMPVRLCLATRSPSLHFASITVKETSFALYSLLFSFLLFVYKLFEQATLPAKDHPTKVSSQPLSQIQCLSTFCKLVKNNGEVLSFIAFWSYTQLMLLTFRICFILFYCFFNLRIKKMNPLNISVL